MLLALALSLLAAAPQSGVAPGGDPLERSEGVAAAVAARVRALGEAFRTAGDPLEADGAQAWIDGDARAVLGPGPEVVARWAAPDAPRPVQVERRAEAPLEMDASTGPEDAADDVRAAFEAVAEALGGAPDRAAEVSVKAVTPGPGGTFDVRLRVRHARRTPGVDARVGAVSARSVWTLRVTLDRAPTDGGAGDVRLLAWAGGVVDRVEAPEGAAFEDVTGVALGGSPAAGWLGESIMSLRDRLDVDVGVGILGHHGVAVADVNGDGLEDLYLCQPGGVPNQLWVRLPGGGFLEAAAAGGLDLVDATTSALFVDLDGDGDLDVVLGLGTGVVVLARTDGGYREAARFERAGITSLAAADVNLDGRLDVYACAYANPYDGTTFPLPYHDAENGQQNLLLANVTEEPDRLLLGDATAEAGLDVGGARFSFAATFEDVDDDGDPDLYVANDFGRNALYVNNGTGFFLEEGAARGVEDVAAGMGAAFADLDRDGRVDLYVSNMESSAGRRITGQAGFQEEAGDGVRALFRRHAKGNTLFLRDEDGAFVDSGLATRGQWAWGAIPTDLDGNGWLDLFVPNGFISAERPGAPDL